MDILTGNNLSSIKLSNMYFIFGQFFHPVGGVKGVDKGTVILVTYKHNLIRVHGNLVQHQSNNILIVYRYIYLSIQQLTDIPHCL